MYTLMCTLMCTLMLHELRLTDATTSAPTKKTKRSPKRGGGAANPGGKDRTQSGRTGASGKKANSGRTLSLECNLCHQEGHFMKDCPDLEELSGSSQPSKTIVRRDMSTLISHLRLMEMIWTKLCLWQLQTV